MYMEENNLKISLVLYIRLEFSVQEFVGSYHEPNTPVVT